MANVTFITGNEHKAAYLERQLDMPIKHRSAHLDELQSFGLHEIVAHKLEQAYTIVKSPVLVEDVSLVFHALGELPGPFIKWFIEGAGSEACCRMLDGFNDKSATIICTFGYYDGTDMHFFDSNMLGSISSSPRGANGFGFDTIFCMQSDTRTRAELPQDEVERTYAEQMKPFAQVRDFLTTLQ